MTEKWQAGRLNSDLQGANIDTLAVRAGQERSPEGEHSESMFLTSSYVFASAADAAARFSGENPGNVYSRYTNPTVRSFEKRLAAMEGAEQAVATSSGMAAILALVMSLCNAGDHVVVSQSVFGTTISLFDKYFKRFGVEVTYVPLADISGWEHACKVNTKLFFVESPSNPLSELVDIKALARLAQSKSILLAVDNSFCTPILQKPIELGADIVIYSATKYIDGQGRCMGGALVGREDHMKEMVGFLRTAGPTMSPFNAWVFLKGLETLKLRMLAHSQSTLEIAKWLEQQPKVERVYYSGLPTHSQHELAKQQQKGFGAVLGFDIVGGKEAAWKVVDATRLISITANLGDTKTTITHPATTTHGRVSPEARALAGIKDGLLRLSVGLEDVEDIKADLARGLALI